MTKKESTNNNSDLTSGINIPELQSYFDSLRKNNALFEEKNFDQRTEVIDFIEFHIDHIEELLKKEDPPDTLISLKHHAEKIKSALDEINIKLFQNLRTAIQQKRYDGKEFKKMVSEYFDSNVENKEQLEGPCYDNLDIFINGLLSSQPLPDQTKDMEPEMVYYQKTPARIVFELIEKFHFKSEDVFFDIGSGLGQAAILVNLLAGIRTVGVEFEPAFCQYARDCASELNLSNVSFINVDARQADYSEGTIFFMFTPFKGEMLQAVLEILRKESQSRKIKIITYGPCTAQVALEDWLEFVSEKQADVYKLGFFSSL